MQLRILLYVAPMQERLRLWTKKSSVEMNGLCTFFISLKMLLFGIQYKTHWNKRHAHFQAYIH